MKTVRSIPAPTTVQDPEVRRYLEALRAVLLDIDNGKQRMVSIQELEEAGIARLVGGKLTKM